MTPPLALNLVEPVAAHGEAVSRLTFRQPRAGDLRDFRIGDSTVGNFIPLIATLAGIPPSSVESMHPADVIAAIGLIGPLLLPPQSTGETS